MVGLRLGVLTVEAYTIVVLVAIVTSVMAPPILRFTMARIEHTAEERLRESRDLPPVGQPQRLPSPTQTRAGLREGRQAGRQVGPPATPRACGRPG